MVVVLLLLSLFDDTLAQFTDAASGELAQLLLPSVNGTVSFLLILKLTNFKTILTVYLR